MNTFAKHCTSVFYLGFYHKDPGRPAGAHFSASSPRACFWGPVGQAVSSEGRRVGLTPLENTLAGAYWDYRQQAERDTHTQTLFTGIEE